jgi:hypothetical protein
MARAIEPPGKLAVATQDTPGALGDRPPVAAADEAACPEEGIGDEVGRPLAVADDLVQEFYGGGNPRPVSRLFSFQSMPLR